MENWKPIPGYEGLYEASDCGRIRTCDGKATSNARFPKRVWQQRILKPKTETRKSGRFRDERVNLWKDGKEKTLLVARLVALTWCDGYQEGYTVNHIDGNPTNNKASNLEWVSLKENILHGFETGLYPQIPCSLIAEDGERLSFRSMSQASIFLDRNPSYIHNCIKYDKNAVSASGQAYQIVIQKTIENAHIV